LLKQLISFEIFQRGQIKQKGFAKTVEVAQKVAHALNITRSVEIVHAARSHRVYLHEQKDP